LGGGEHAEKGIKKKLPRTLDGQDLDVGHNKHKKEDNLSLVKAGANRLRTCGNKRKKNKFGTKRRIHSFQKHQRRPGVESE